MALVAHLESFVIENCVVSITNKKIWDFLNKIISEVVLRGSFVFDGQLFRKDKNPSTLVVRSIPRRWPHQPDDRFAGNARNNYRCVG